MGERGFEGSVFDFEAMAQKYCELNNEKLKEIYQDLEYKHTASEVSKEEMFPRWFNRNKFYIIPAVIKSDFKGLSNFL